MFRVPTFGNRFQWLLLATVATLPILTVNLVCWIAFSLNALTAPRSAWSALLRRDSQLWIYLPLLLVCTVSIAWSHDWFGGLSKLETMGPLILGPVALGRAHLTPEFVRRLYRTFIGSVTACAVFALGYGVSKYWQYDGWYRYFPDGTVRDHHVFYTGLSDQVMHPGYFSVYVGIAVLLLARLGAEAERRLPYWLLGGFLVVFLVMLQGRINILSFALVTLPWLAWRLVRDRHPFEAAGIFLAVGLVTVAALQTLPQPVADRFTEEVSTDYDVEAPRLGEFSGLTIRLAEWESIWPTVTDNWVLGVGIGDAQEAIGSAYEERGFVVGSRNDFNAHNQYLQTWLSAGLPALLALLFVLAALTWHAIRNRDVVLAMAAWYFFLSMLTESMLERNWAGSLFATVLFVMALASHPRDRDENPEPEPVTTP